ncbi:28 kDa ribonucleoprotein, chloroplastic-like [Zingiber officinale]|uniref:RRM domain-containing protein n=1 Tax=Zingiber officinale TaxID=94328 RepID=A0A8J5KXR2_ZINOF|nr:28 kDa ribonucleoprotein, chloroplastic-like [Zingiber officinale]KAG6494523.1 hypothetical protein ZIOFF_049555 [Zingiber officinale]
MAAAARIFNSISMAEALLPSLPTAPFSSKPPFPLLPLSRSSKPFPFLHLSRSPSPLFLKKSPPFLLLVAKTSDWARQDEDTEVDDGEFGYDEAGSEASDGIEEYEGDEEQTLEGGLVAEADGEFVEEERYAEPPEEAKLYVGNLPYDVDSEGLAQLFEKAGVVEVAEVIYNRQTDQSRGFGFVTMSTVEEADKAVELLHRFEINGRLLTVNKASPRGTRVERTPRTFEPSSLRIYVGNLPWQVDDARLEQIFSEHGKVVEARVLYDRESGRSRGFGFVKMESQAEMEDAIAALDGQSLDGRAIRVNVAEERPPRRAF